MSIDAVLSDVELSAFKPTNAGFGEIPLKDLVPFFLPDKMLGDLGPKSFWVLDAALMVGPVLFQRTDLIRITHAARFNRFA